MPAPARNMSALAPLGRLGKAHGIRGELRCMLEADSPELLSGEVILKPCGQGEERRLLVERTRVHHGSLLVAFKGVSTRDEAQRLSRHSIYVPKERLPALAEDEAYLSDLPGLRVFVRDSDAESGQDERTAMPDSREIGVIASVAVPAGQEIWSIVSPEGKEILFPAVERFVLSIDLVEGKAVIAPPPGLLALYLSESFNQCFPGSGS